MYDYICQFVYTSNRWIHDPVFLFMTIRKDLCVGLVVASVLRIDTGVRASYAVAVIKWLF